MKSHRASLLITAVIMLPMFAAVGGASQHIAPQHSREVAHPRARTTWDSVFSPAQAARGESTYAKTCSRCHTPSLGGADEAPALTGAAFMSGWNGQTLAELHKRIITSMPTDTPGLYKRQDVVDVIAYVLKFNAFPAGNTELPVDDEALKAISFVTSKP